MQRDDVPRQDSPQRARGPVLRVLSVLEALADAEEPVQVNALAEQLSLAPSTTHRMLNLLCAEGWAQQSAHDQRYSAGPSFYRVAARVVDKVSVADLARPYLRAVAAESGETALLGLHLASQHAVAFVAREDGGHPLQYRITMNQPTSLVWGASGKAVLAHLSGPVVRQALEVEGPSPATGAAPTSLPELQRALEAIRGQGFATSEGEKLQGARGIAAPVFDSRGVVGCLMVTGPRDRITEGTEAALIRSILTHAAELSATLGGRPPQPSSKEDVR